MPGACEVSVPAGLAVLTRSCPALRRWRQKRPRPALRFRFPPALGSGGSRPARSLLLGESEKSRARRSPSRGGESREAVPRGTLRLLAAGNRSRAGCARYGHDSAAAAAAAVAIGHRSVLFGEGLGPGVLFQPRGPGRGGLCATRLSCAG